ncbi:Riboflavin synthase-like beta-barrel [Niveomyces insectorum RCEF 264]|uniref:Riboflavin synthase-like beta-barrel n=1 Tax=Niveomyces insectorum RCEF 264 TaxID=1081102 RepID=A0A167LXJ3_9HYPO|nr:Riboflavin synthase-like beta-barrel [Niveomyces insectorum RCEF 264]
MTEPVPSLPGWPVIGNLLDVQVEVPIEAPERLGDIYRPITTLYLAGIDRYIVTGFDIFGELCDETRFFQSSTVGVHAERSAWLSRNEVEHVVDKDRVQATHLAGRPYLEAVLRETLRLSPTAPGFARGVRLENKTEHVAAADGKYEIPCGAALLGFLGKMQRDPKVWADNADQFKPERMLDENFSKLPKNAWKVRMGRARTGASPSTAATHGYAPAVHDLNSAVEHLPTDQSVVIVTASSEGEPPDNAARFVAWLARITGPGVLCGDALCQFSVVGGRDREQGEHTRRGQRHPSARCPRSTSPLSTEECAAHLQQGLSWARVTAAQPPTAPGHHPEKLVLPGNLDDDVRRVFRHFGLPWDAAAVTIGKAWPTLLPTDVPDVDVLLALATDAAETVPLRALCDEDAFAAIVLARRTSLLDLLEQNPGVPLPLAGFLAMLPPLRVRPHSSIASLPLAHSDNAYAFCYRTLLPTPRNGNPFHGVAGTCLRSLRVGDQALVAVRATNRVSRLPPDPAATPLILVCAGAGLAPFLRFLEERAVRIRDGGRRLALALLFVGCRDCRNPDADRLHADQPDAWGRDDIMAEYGGVRYAFSERPESPLAAGCRYVYERLQTPRDAADMIRLWEQGAKVYTCGSGRGRWFWRRPGQSAGDGAAAHMTEAKAEAWLQKQQHSERFVADVST